MRADVSTAWSWSLNGSVLSPAVKAECSVSKNLRSTAESSRLKQSVPVYSGVMQVMTSHSSSLVGRGWWSHELNERNWKNTKIRFVL